MAKPILYLDVEGTLLLFGAGRAFFRPHLESLIRFVRTGLDRVDALWLTSYSFAQLQSLFSAGGLDVRGIGYKSWSGCKAEALERDASVLWIDDRLTDRDRMVLDERTKQGSRIVYRPIRRWAGDPEDQELLALQEDIQRWLDRSAPGGSASRCEMVA